MRLFPRCAEAFEDLDAPDSLERLACAPDPASAARLTTAQISAALKRARRRGIAAKAERIQAVLRAAHLGQPDTVTAAYAASAHALGSLHEQVAILQNYAATSPITRASGKKKTVAARHIHNDRLIDALMSQAFAALQASPGARAYYDCQRARGAGHNPALRQLANRLVGILHGCLKTRTRYDEATAWPQYATKTDQTAA